MVFLNKLEKGQKSLGLIDRLVLTNKGKRGDFIIHENDVIKLCDSVCVPDVPKLKKSILKEGHRGGLSIHLGDTKMYQDLKKMFL